MPEEFNTIFPSENQSLPITGGKGQPSSSESPSDATQRVEQKLEQIVVRLDRMVKEIEQINLQIEKIDTDLIYLRREVAKSHSD